MLEPKEADIPILFLFLVVFPLVAYVLLGTWSESTKKRDRISLLAQLAAEEALRVEAMATDCAPPVIPTPNNGIHVCARCFSQATTRCSRCKAVRYCSGKCQIIHWRQFHKQECQLLEANCSSISPNTVNEDSFFNSVSVNENLNSYSGYNKKQAMIADTASSDISCPSISMTTSFRGNCSAIETSQEAIPQRNIDKHISCQSSRVMLRRQDVIVCDSLEETSGSKLSNGSNYNDISGNGQDAVSTMHETYKYSRRRAKSFELRSRITISSSNRGKSGTHVNEPESDLISSGDNLPSVQNTINDEVAAVKGSLKNKSSLHSSEVKVPKSKSKMTLNGEHSYSGIEGKPNIAGDSQISKLRDTAHQLGINGVPGINIMKMMGLRKSTKLARQDVTEFKGMHGKIRTLFPYEEFMKIFNCEVVNLLPRGLINCGNSCYANAVLQCLTYTKPLAIFLLQRLHSRNCRGKDWCLMCELEQHVMMLRECGSPLSPSRILLHMRNTNCQIGHGSQEDAHEFLRLLVASMQSICLEGLGGEDMVDLRLQETTFIQHTFGGCLRSKVKCLRCHHESERYENIMDLSLEIFGWVESLEDALTQFTTPEELDGENMYRCGSCGTYARARKQLSIHEAPNILTIVLKRFQEGKYGKINKCITFPDMLDMIPFMTRTVDIPSLYMLYAVVVHLDSLNASFSGHYVSYVKDSLGNWFRIDDTEVQPVPMSQVMSEGAYILFYKRSFPRPMKVFDEIGTKKVPVSAIHCTSRTRKPSKQEQSKYSSYFGVPKPSVDIKPQISSSTNSQANGGILRSANGNIAQVDFSDATSSDWSLFTSSDEASFTTESTRDSFSTVDYTDTSNVDTFTSIFDNLYAPKSSSVNTACCRKFSNSIAQSRFVLEERGYVSYMSNQPPNRSLKGDNFEQVSDSSNGNYYSMSVKFGSNERCNLDRTCCHCKL